MRESNPTQESVDSYFKFTEMIDFYKRLGITASFIALCVILTIYWLEATVLFCMYHVFINSEKAIRKSCNELQENGSITLKSQFTNKIFGFGDIICSYICGVVLYFSISKPYNLVGSIINSFLMSFCVFFLIGSMKSIAIGFQFFRTCDIENGALGLLTQISIIFRYILVSPIWLCYVSDVPQNQIPNKLSKVAQSYIIAKVIGLLFLCSNFSSSIKQFFSAVFISIKGCEKCQKCGSKDKNLMMTQCSHILCMDCIDRARKVLAKCSICQSPIPRKWTLPYCNGFLSETILYFTL